MQGDSDSHNQSYGEVEPDAAAPRTILDLISRRAALTPHAPALIAADSAQITYHALHMHMVETGQALRAAGIGRTDTVATITGAGPGAAATFLAVSAACVCAPLNPTYRASELEFYLDDLRARLVVVAADIETEVQGVAKAREIAVAELVSAVAGRAGHIQFSQSDGTALEADMTTAEDDALVLHTSGTTARPKIVPMTHGRLTTSAATIATTLQLQEHDRCLNVMPLFHIHGLVAGLMAPLLAGGSVICPPAFDGAHFVEWIENLQPTWYTAVPTMHQAVLGRLQRQNTPSPRHHLRFARSSSAPLPRAVLDGIEQELGVPVIEAYGMTEAAHQIASNPLPPLRRIPGTVGMATGPEISILGEDGGEVEPGHVGEVAIRGDSIFDGYRDNPEANATAFVRGWFRTGDLGVLDGNGYLELRGRIKEIINRGGEKIAPAEIDDLLLRHPAVAQSVTFGIPDPRLGEDVAAAVVLVDGSEADERALQYFVAQTLAPFKVPRRIVFVDEIPKGPTGKVQRIGMHERLGISEERADDTENGYVRPRSHLESELARVWADVLGVDRVGTTDDFFALGGDSLLGAEAVARIRDLIGRPELPLISIVRAPTPARMVDEIRAGDRPADVVLPLREGGMTRSPIFITHAGDLIVGLPAIACRLREDHPVYGLMPSLEGPPWEQLSIVGMAAELVTALKCARPHGPYVLAGICSGGPVVMEMARLLQSRGDTIELLILIDPRVRSRRNLSFLASKVAYHARNKSVTEAIARRARRVAGRDSTIPDFYNRISVARDAYDVNPLVGVPAVLVTTDDYSRRFAILPKVWRGALPDGFATRGIPFPHDTLLFPPAVDALASVIDDLVAAGS